MNNYHNTTNLSGPVLKLYQNKATKQDDLILDLFTANPQKEFTPEDAHEVLFTARVPLTSLRRSFNTLEKEGRIERTGRMVIGGFGRPINTYKLKQAASPQLNLL